MKRDKNEQSGWRARKEGKTWKEVKERWIWHGQVCKKEIKEMTSTGLRSYWKKERESEDTWKKVNAKITGNEKMMKWRGIKMEN